LEAEKPTPSFTDLLPIYPSPNVNPAILPVVALILPSSYTINLESFKS
jgi:hypothetical protein